MKSRDVKVTIIVRESVNGKDAKISEVLVTWRNDVSLDEILEHSVDSIERIDN